MSLSARDARTLARIEEEFRRCDPALSARFTFFARLAGDEEVPRRGRAALRWKPLLVAVLLLLPLIVAALMAVFSGPRGCTPAPAYRLAGSAFASPSCGHRAGGPARSVQAPGSGRPVPGRRGAPVPLALAGGEIVIWLAARPPLRRRRGGHDSEVRVVVHAGTRAPRP